MDIIASTCFTKDYTCFKCNSHIAIGTPHIEFEVSYGDFYRACKSCIESIIHLLKTEADNYEVNLAAHKKQEAVIREKIKTAKLQHNLQLTVIRSALKEKKIMTSKLSFSGFSKHNAIHDFRNDYHGIAYYDNHATQSKRIRRGPEVTLFFEGDIITVSIWVKQNPNASALRQEMTINLNNPNAISQLGDAILNYNPLLPVRK